MIFAPQFPLEFNSTHGFSNVLGIKQLIFFHLKNLLFTYPGEKISDLEYGVGITSFLFQQGTEGLFNNLADEITAQISRYLPYLILNFVTVEPEDDIQMRIQVSYSLPNINLDEVATFYLDGNSV